jgi:glycosyltransferase involved in cell wall biosynthesis
MKIAFLIIEIHPNAGQTYNIAEIIRYLLSAHPDWEISILTNRIYYPLVKGIDDNRVKIIKIDQYYTAIIFRGKIARMLMNYDFLYIKGNYPYVFPAIKSGKPTALVVHQIDSPKLSTNSIAKIKIILANIMTGYVIRKPKFVVTVTDELASFYQKKYGIKLHVIEDQIPDFYFSSQRRSVIEEGRIIKLLTVGNWDGFNGRKRHEFLLSYFAAAVKSLPNIRLNMCGLSTENIKELNKLVVEMNLLGKVNLKEYMKDEELYLEYLSNDIYVTATTFEGFYRQVVEGFATGMPAVVFDSREFVGDTSKSASVNHVLKSGAGEIYKDAETFILSLKNVMQNYMNYSIKAIKYASNFSSHVLGKKTEGLILSAVSYRKTEET